jgi:hypothetical protein
MIRFFHRRSMAAALALAALAGSAPAVWAQQPSGNAVAAANDPANAAYGDLYSAMQEGVDQSLVLDSALVAMGREFAANPDFAAAETASPGLIAEVTSGMRPILEGQSERLTQLYRPATLALFARYLTPEEATSIAAFYRSDLGRKLMGNLSQSYSPDQTLSNINTATDVTTAQVKADIDAATQKVIGQMSQTDLAEMGRLAMANPALLKLGQIGTGVQELRAQMENEPLTAEEDAAVVAMVEEVFIRRLGAF